VLISSPVRLLFTRVPGWGLLRCFMVEWTSCAETTPLKKKKGPRVIINKKKKKDGIMPYLIRKRRRSAHAGTRLGIITFLFYGWIDFVCEGDTTF